MHIVAKIGTKWKSTNSDSNPYYSTIQYDFIIIMYLNKLSNLLKFQYY